MCTVSFENFATNMDLVKAKSESFSKPEFNQQQKKHKSHTDIMNFRSPNSVTTSIHIKLTKILTTNHRESHLWKTSSTICKEIRIDLQKIKSMDERFCKR